MYIAVFKAVAKTPYYPPVYKPEHTLSATAFHDFKLPKSFLQNMVHSGNGLDSNSKYK